MAKPIQADENKKTAVRQTVADQRVELFPADELRKAVNVLTTSDPKNPVPNPFVHGQGNGSNQASNSNGKNDNKKSE